VKLLPKSRNRRSSRPEGRPISRPRPMKSGKFPPLFPLGGAKNRLSWIFFAITVVVVGLGGLLYINQLNKVAVPDLIGISLDEAVARLGQEHLKPGTVRPMPSEQPPGSVVEQDPAPGTRLPSGSPVNLVLAEKKLDKLVVPDLIASPSTKPLRAWSGNI